MSVNGKMNYTIISIYSQNVIPCSLWELWVNLNFGKEEKSNLNFGKDEAINHSPYNKIKSHANGCLLGNG